MTGPPIPTSPRLESYKGSEGWQIPGSGFKTLSLNIRADVDSLFLDFSDRIKTDKEVDWSDYNIHMINLNVSSGDIKKSNKDFDNVSRTSSFLRKQNETEYFENVMIGNFTTLHKALSNIKINKNSLDIKYQYGKAPRAGSSGYELSHYR